MNMRRILMDPNSYDRAGRTMVLADDGGGKLFHGQIVTAFDPDDGTQALARVTALEGQWAKLNVMWSSMCDDDGSQIKVAHLDGPNRAAVAVANETAESHASASSSTFAAVHRSIDRSS